MRIDGYAPIREYALIGDGRTTALVAKDGAIDWLCLPNIDSPSVCGAIVDAERGGAFVVQPAVPFESSRQYRSNTNILETTFTTDRGSVRLTDVMPLPDARLAPMRELARAIEGLSGTVPMRWRFEPRFDYGAARPECGWRYGVPTATWRGDAVAICSWNAGETSWRGETVEARFDVHAGDRALITLVGSHTEPLLFPDREAVEDRIRQTEAFWQQWTGKRGSRRPLAGSGFSKRPRAQDAYFCGLRRLGGRTDDIFA